MNKQTKIISTCLLSAMAVLGIYLLLNCMCNKRRENYTEKSSVKVANAYADRYIRGVSMQPDQGMHPAAHAEQDSAEYYHEFAGESDMIDKSHDYFDYVSGMYRRGQ